MYCTLYTHLEIFSYNHIVEHLQLEKHVGKLCVEIANFLGEGVLKKLS